MTSSSIYGNTAGAAGGGVYVSGGTVAFSSCTINGNSNYNVYVDGGTVCSWATTLTVVAGSVSACPAPPPQPQPSPPSPPSPPPLPSPPPSPPPITCGPGTFLSSITHQCEIVCDPASNGRRKATELPLDTALCRIALDDALDDVQTLGDRLRKVQTLGDRMHDVGSYLEEHPEVAASINDEDFASIKDEELRSRLKQLFGQPALA